MQTTRSFQVFLISVVVLTLFFTLSHLSKGIRRDNKVTHYVKDSHSSFKSTLKTTLSFGKKVPEPRPANETLDFQEIIYLSMPYRTDRQDAMSLIAAVAGLKLTMIPGITPDEIHPKAMPPHTGNNNMTGTAPLGIWRAHANVWRYIIDNNISTALIIEDDVDFDVNIKEIMGMLNWQLHYNNTIRWGDKVEKGWDEDCPYGCDWDEIFVGQCGGKPNGARLDLHQVYAEPNSPPLSQVQAWVKREMTEIWNLTESDGVRVIAPTYEPICLMGYGVSRMGAMRMLYQIGGWRPFGYPVDNELAWRTSEGVLSGYTMTPPALTSWRVGGSQDSDNDPGMNAMEVQNLGNMQGKSENLKNSVRKSLAKFFEKNYWRDMEEERRW